MKTTIITIIAVLSLSLSAQANVLVDDTFTGEAMLDASVISYTMDTKGDYKNAPMVYTNTAWGDTLWSGRSYISIGALDQVYTQMVAITDHSMDNINVAVDYINKQSYGGTLYITVGETLDGELLWSQRVFYVWQNQTKPNATLMANDWIIVDIDHSYILAKVGEDRIGHINTVIVGMNDIIGPTGSTQFMDNIVISSDVYVEPVVEEVVEPQYVTVEKEGYYTADMGAIEGAGCYYINDSETCNTWNTGLVHMGYLYTGDTIRILYNSLEAEEIVQLDWQSWDFMYESGAVVIYVEDPPMCEPVVEYVESECIQNISRADVDNAFENGMNFAAMGMMDLNAENNTLLARVADLEAQLTAALADDGNNGHGNDEGKYDSSNPGKSKK